MLSACGLTGIPKLDAAVQRMEKITSKTLTEVQCRAVAVAPAAQYITGDIADDILQDKIDFVDLLKTLEVSPDLVESVSRGFKACKK